jgi:hypothetical protein
MVRVMQSNYERLPNNSINSDRQIRYAPFPSVMVALKSLLQNAASAP